MLVKTRSGRQTSRPGDGYAKMPSLMKHHGQFERRSIKFRAVGCHQSLPQRTGGHAQIGADAGPGVEICCCHPWTIGAAWPTPPWAVAVMGLRFARRSFSIARRPSRARVSLPVMLGLIALAAAALFATQAWAQVPVSQQAATADYLREMPAVGQVVTDMRGGDAMEARAKQI